MSFFRKLMMTALVAVALATPLAFAPRAEALIYVNLFTGEVVHVGGPTRAGAQHCGGTPQRSTHHRPAPPRPGAIRSPGRAFRDHGHGLKGVRPHGNRATTPRGHAR